ncbi:12801_t:CDS:2 [Funneliformis mosseae]|uniref:12801_t:CDS:1 n=1 Tax=Funneliformis mosseae TaxID=27381 RepID=A0A9N9BI53_FUNMO|nr:12801_t:CDS:2 [Funneliformis mosseae]
MERDELKDVIKKKIIAPVAKGLKIRKVEIPDNDDKLANLLLNDRDELLATKKIRKYFPKEPYSYYYIFTKNCQAGTLGSVGRVAKEPYVLDGNQLRIIGEIVRPNEESDDDLFEDKDTFENDDKNFHEEIPLSTKDHTNADVAFISDLIRFTIEGYHLDWMFTVWKILKRTGSKCEDTSNILSSTFKVQKTLRDMHRNLIESISDESCGMLSNPVLHASNKLLMPGFCRHIFLTCYDDCQFSGSLYPNKI